MLNPCRCEAPHIVLLGHVLFVVGRCLALLDGCVQELEPGSGGSECWIAPAEGSQGALVLLDSMHWTVSMGSPKGVPQVGGDGECWVVLAAGPQGGLVTVPGSAARDGGDSENCTPLVIVERSAGTISG